MESRVSAHGIAAGVWHHRRCISLRLDSIHPFGMIPFATPSQFHTADKLRISCTPSA
jgi:hypothetical protein